MKSPGHRAHPEHKVHESRVGRRMTVEVNGELVADSTDVVEVDEDGSPPRFYFPRTDVNMNKLSATPTTSACPFKGEAHYFSLSAGGRTLPDAVWTYEAPYDEHVGLKDRVAFWDDKSPEITIRAQ